MNFQFYKEKGSECGYNKQKGVLLRFLKQSKFESRECYNPPISQNYSWILVHF